MSAMISLHNLKNDNKSEISQNVNINVHNGDVSQKDIKVSYEPDAVLSEPSEVIRDFPSGKLCGRVYDPERLREANESVSDLILQFILKDIENHDGYILLSIDELKKVLKVLCKCDDVIIDVEPMCEVRCCNFTTYDVSGMLNVKKILIKYNNKECLENFKMHYNEIKILTESYKVDISHVKSN